MPPTPELTHLTHHHRDALRQIFTHPISHNIEWPGVVSLLEALDAVEVRHDGKFVVKLGKEIEVFERPRGKDLDAEQVVDLRRMLRNAGYEPDASEAE
jgi:hypothetical protein